MLTNSQLHNAIREFVTGSYKPFQFSRNAVNTPSGESPGSLAFYNKVLLELMNMSERSRAKLRAMTSEWIRVGQ